VARASLALVAVAASVAGSFGPADPPADVVMNSVGMRMVRVAPGTFVMGSPPGEPMRQEEETPHPVTLTRGFRIAATEVTERQWLAVMPRGRSLQASGDRPVASVSWKEAQEFCLELSRKEGRAYRLPTEAEWEYACRAGAASATAAGTDLAAVAWYSENSDGTTHPVGLKAPNAWGLHDTLGNVAEWTADVYSPYPRGEVKDPAGPGSGSTRVVRGGSWRSFPPALRCAARVGTPESYQMPHVGLRVVQEIE
jgi:formylglycine-generating enzyme required for sulfatase activity